MTEETKPEGGALGPFLPCKRCGERTRINYIHRLGSSLWSIACEACGNRVSVDICDYKTMVDAWNEQQRYQPKHVTMILNDQPPAPVGWLCPKCGRGNAPTCMTCLCVPVEYKVTC